MTRVATALVLLSLLSCASAPPPPKRTEIDFKSELSRYGEWIVVRPYGRVWHPHARVVGTPFVPYLTGGQWVPRDGSWEFQSRWEWGAYTFHYGRWFMGQDLGWVWWPDQAHGPAWVDWRFGGGYVGWAPQPPPPPVNSTLPPEPQRWVFVKARQFTQAELEPYQLPPDEVNRVLGIADPLPVAIARLGPKLEQIREEGGVTADGGVPDLTPPPEAVPVVVPDEKKEEPAPAPPPAKKKKKKSKKTK